MAQRNSPGLTVQRGPAPWRACSPIAPRVSPGRLASNQPPSSPSDANLKQRRDDKRPLLLQILSHPPGIGGLQLDLEVLISLAQGGIVPEQIPEGQHLDD